MLERAPDDLLYHMEWADSLIWSVVLASPAACADLGLKDRLYHIHVTQHAFLQVWRGQIAQLPASNTFDMEGLARWARTFYSAALEDKSWLTTDALDQRVPDSLLSKAEERLGVGSAEPQMIDTLFQVILHSTHHRGQVCTRLRELGCEPPLSEYFVWVWRGKPRADWTEPT
jgi:uncharacterized damage-inducible protein DinB